MIISDVYQLVTDAGIPTASHESDLYVKATPGARKILTDAGANFTTFVNQLDKSLWFDVPFAYTPWWDKRVGKAVA